MTGRQQQWHEQPGPVAGRLLEWMAAVRDHPDRPRPAQRYVLCCLALRLDWKTGRGFASVTQLAGDAGCGASTVKRAIAWALGHRLLHRQTRGRHLWNGAATVSGWEPRLPSQQVRGDPLTGSPQQVRGDPLTDRSTGQRRPTQQVRGGPHNRSPVTPITCPKGSGPNESSPAARHKASERPVPGGAVSNRYLEVGEDPPPGHSGPGRAALADPEQIGALAAALRPAPDGDDDDFEAERRRQLDRLAQWERANPGTTP